MVDVTGEPQPERERLARPWSITSHTAWQLEEGGEALRCFSGTDADRWAQQPGGPVCRVRRRCCAAAALVFNGTTAALTPELSFSCCQLVLGHRAGLQLDR
jgi:hypothetical protein